MPSRRIIKKLDVSDRPEQPHQADHEICRVFIPEENDVPLVECTKNGDVITQIDIRCSCGQVTRLVCEYGDST